MVCRWITSPRHAQDEHLGKAYWENQ